ncbi:hypothetical protein ACFPRA_02205 [Sporosarcina soli]|uniref:Uncharacterized protein n=1 Tax=Sporosarcina soli TaxID=334736 RepID=A0ABW0TGD0_9BACL
MPRERPVAKKRTPNVLAFSGEISGTGLASGTGNTRGAYAVNNNFDFVYFLFVSLNAFSKPAPTTIAVPTYPDWNVFECFVQLVAGADERF